MIRLQSSPLLHKKPRALQDIKRTLCAKMAFKQRPSAYRIGKAPTGRGRCRKCRKPIPKGATRVEISAFVRPGRSTLLLRCTACIDARFATAVLAVYKCARRVPVDPEVDEAAASRVRDSITTASSCIG